MKLQSDVKQQVIELLNKGLSSRKIAKKLAISKSSVNNIRNATLGAYNTDNFKVTTCFLDIETAPSTALVFGRYNQNISEDAIIKQGNFILSIAYKLQKSDGSAVTGSLILNPEEIAAEDDKRLCYALLGVYLESNIVVAHNLKGFDHKIIQARFLKNNLGALPSVKFVDTLQISKQYLKLNSNKLDSLANYFAVDRKMKNSGITLWKEVLQGDPKAIKEMQDYNIQDVVVLEQVYNKLKPLQNKVSNLNYSLMLEKLTVCPNCGSHAIAPSGKLVYTANNAYLEYECSDCKANFRGKKSVTPANIRKNLLVKT